MDRALTIPFEIDTRTRFVTPVMSSTDPPCAVSQSITGAFLLVDYAGTRYLISVERIAVALMESVRGAL
jgi:hypothetical protein